MKAIEIVKPGEIKLVEREMPQLGNEEILLKINYVGFCGSDLSTYLGKNPMVDYPRIPGHEISASIEKIGNNVPEKFVPGQKVTVVPYTNCGQCSSCKQKKYNENPICKLFDNNLGQLEEEKLKNFFII